MKKKIICIAICIMSGTMLCACGKAEEKTETSTIREEESSLNNETQSSTKISQTKTDYSIKTENVEKIYIYHGNSVKEIDVVEEKGKEIIDKFNQFLLDEKNKLGIADCNLTRKGNGASLGLQKDAYCVEICFKEPTDIKYAGWEGVEEYKNVLSIQADSTEDLICLSTKKANGVERITYGALKGEPKVKDVAVTKEIIDLVIDLV